MVEGMADPSPNSGGYTGVLRLAQDRFCLSPWRGWRFGAERREKGKTGGLGTPPLRKTGRGRRVVGETLRCRDERGGLWGMASGGFQA